ncbi:MAG TPA: MXAN_5187 C-terminal domain-containing protein [Pyrinomonadaceae bacterium]|nr:MXAN_5187 C-terminal domain-containing protein [Pyrinomonadaceae bacterium]
MPIDNKLLRAQRRTKTKSKYVEEEPTVDDQLTRLEDDIRRLKVEFDIFFNGASKRPPYDTKGRVETVFKRLGDDRTLTYAQRYRYNSLATRYNAFRELWRRTMKGREEGRDPVSAARATAKQEAAAEFSRSTFVCADAHKDVETVKQLYSALLAAKKACGEPTHDLSFPRFHHLIASQADSLKERLGCESVSFSVDVDRGHVSFKAKGERR